MKMLKEIGSSTESHREKYEQHLKVCYKLFCRGKWLSNKGAILIIFWSYFVTSVFYLMRSDSTSENFVSLGGIILVTSTLLYPIGGWLADTHFGRYKVIHYSMWIIWIGIVLATFSNVMSNEFSAYSEINVWIFRALRVIMAIGLGGFQSNIVQFGVDQLTDASTIEITSFIMWYALTLYASGVTMYFVSECVVDKYNIFYIKLLYVAFCLTVALCTDYLFHRWLIKEQFTQNSLSLIWKVIKYTIKNRNLRYDFTTEELPSQFDIAKHRHGGPFTAQQVENVCTFLWLLVIIAFSTLLCGAITPIWFAKEKIENHLHNWQQTRALTGCYEKLSVRYSDYMFPIILVLSYNFIIHPLFSKCLPKLGIISTLLLGTILSFVWTVSLLAIVTLAYYRNHHLNFSNNSVGCIFIGSDNDPEMHISYKWMLVPGLINSLATFLLVLSALKLFWSQTPSVMKGLIMGLFYAFLGMSSILHVGIAYPFFYKNPIDVQWEHAPLTCGIWYFIMEGVIILAAIVVISFFARSNKKRNEYTSLVS